MFVLFRTTRHFTPIYMKMTKIHITPLTIF